MTRKPVIYPVFLPNAGCPFQCMYCDQHAVTAVERHSARAQQAAAQIAFLAKHAQNNETHGEIAFYGGTFTGLSRSHRDQLLLLAQGYVDQGIFSGIRFSTRPDSMEADTLRSLARYRITTVELGIQSLSDTVLRSSRRGYTRRQALEALEVVRQYPWKLGIQLMLGLPGDTPERFLASVRTAIGAQPDFVRIHPTLVFPGTELATWTSQGRYLPLTVQQAVDWCVPAYDACIQAAIPVARMGLLLPSDFGSSSAVATGPWHPAYGQLVRSMWWRRRIDSSLKQWPGRIAGRSAALHVGPRYVSDVIGWKRRNLEHWRHKWDLREVSVEQRPDKQGMSFDLGITA